MLKQIQINALFGVTTALGGGYGKYVQLQAIKREIPYEWYIGHLTDLLWPATIVSVGAAITIYTLHSEEDFKSANPENRKKTLNTLDSLILGTAGLVMAGCTFTEYLDSTVGVAFDWQDAVAYILGAGAAYGVYKFSRLFEKNQFSPERIL